MNKTKILEIMKPIKSINYMKEINNFLKNYEKKEKKFPTAEAQALKNYKW